jgi:hypothetical protein
MPNVSEVPMDNALNKLLESAGIKTRETVPEEWLYRALLSASHEASGIDLVGGW